MVRDAQDREAALQLLRAVERHSVDGATVEQMTDGTFLLDVLEDGQVVGAFAVELEGTEAHITAAALRGRYTLTELDLVEQLVHRAGARTIVAYSKRPGMVRLLLGAGYRMEAKFSKDLSHGTQQ